MKAHVKAVPDGFHTVTPALTLKNSLEAIDFYKKAFGAKELGVFPSPDGKSTMHALIQIGDSFLMMGDERPGQGDRSAESLGASPIGMYIYVEDADAMFKQAVDAGATIEMPLADMFWGDRMGTVKDPFGYSWMIATHIRELSDEEVKKGAEAFYAKA
jgi:PhnB protein